MTRRQKAAILGFAVVVLLALMACQVPFGMQGNDAFLNDVGTVATGTPIVPEWLK